jgi:phosphohistidine swiveling domain-containing protein
MRKRPGEIAEHIFALFMEAAAVCSLPCSLLEGMLIARDKNLALRALELTVSLAESGSLIVDRRLVRFIAERVETKDCPLAGADALGKIARIVNRLPVDNPDLQQKSVTSLYLEDKDLKLRFLAARLLDIDGQPASAKLAGKLLGQNAYGFLASYLAYTRASHTDLLAILPLLSSASPALASLREAEKICGKKLFRDVVAELGWQRVNFGIQAQRCIGVSINGSLPLIFSNDIEAALFEKFKGARRVSDSYLLICHGGSPAEERAEDDNIDPVARFREYNLTHAELLTVILDVAPLTPEKVHNILSGMDKIVNTFTALFSSYSEECMILPGLYQELKGKILTELDKDGDQPQLSAELTRLMQTFEDPGSLGEVQTLHGLKRYLHQQGLRLGFHLVEAGRSPNSTVDLVLASQGRILFKVMKIRYADFEPEIESNKQVNQIPYPVSVVIDGFSRQILHGLDKFPNVDIFCYGNEVHYYLAFRNHPVFLRVDYAPPLRGGMIDLEYFGVSNYEISVHPDISLNAIRLFFQRLEFDVQIDGTHIHARYDKERTLNLGELCDKARVIFRLVPYFMDIDWTIGSLKLDKEARLKAAEAWAELFVIWGVLPINQILTKNRRGILQALNTGPTGEQEVSWSGKGSYKDILSAPPPADFYDKLNDIIEKLKLKTHLIFDEDCRLSLGQICIERILLTPLRKALSRGEIIQTSDGFRSASSKFFQREHEAECFAEILASGEDTVASSIALSKLIAPLERILTFTTSGNLNGYEVQSAYLPLRGENLSLYVLRGEKGIIRLSLFARDEILYKRRTKSSAPWESNVNCNVPEMAFLLRSNNYLDIGPEPSIVDAKKEAGKIIKNLRGIFPPQKPVPLPGERIITGLRASPGRTIGKAVFGTAGHNPEDLDGAVLISASVRPEDTTFLYHAAGVVSTGGGILSHAGLIAAQFHKPALIISGRWQREHDESLTLFYTTLEYSVQKKEIEGCTVCIRRDLQVREYCLREGDLIILDAGEGRLRALGQERDALALYEGFRLYGKTNQLLTGVSDQRKILSLRGRKLLARHQIEKTLGRLTDPILARFAVYELLLGKILSDHGTISSERAYLLKIILNNPSLEVDARNYLLQITRELDKRCTDLFKKAIKYIPASLYLHEILSLRLDVLNLQNNRKSTAVSLQECGIEIPLLDILSITEVDLLVRNRLGKLSSELTHKVQKLADAIYDARLRHLLRQLDRVDQILGTGEIDRKPFDNIRVNLAKKDEADRHKFESRYVISHEEGGFEQFPVIGGKAANLAEIERLTDTGLVPPWFVVTDRAFRDVLERPLDSSVKGSSKAFQKASTLRQAINTILERKDLTNDQKSIHILSMWDAVTLPEKLSKEVIKAYHRIGKEVISDNHSKDNASEPFVAIRSSSREEDSEAAARAGEFETYLFIHGEKSLLDYLKRTWSGLWTERAIHNRALLGGNLEQTGGGVIIQRIVSSRVSGVLQTINVAKGELNEIIINAGLGLGEGVVSGTVAADQITVIKEGDLSKGPLRFNYITSDKKEQVVFNSRTGLGIIRTETLYHQRLRPALEYSELFKLVGVAAHLESIYGYPLDIEFGIEGGRLWILQVRPVPTFLSAMRETLERYPLNGKR